MMSIVTIKQSFIERLTSGRTHSRLINFFIKALYGYLLIKLFVLAPAIVETQKWLPFHFTSWLSKVGYLPLRIAQVEPWGYVSLTGLLAIWGLIRKPNAYLALAIFWFSFGLSRLGLSLSNGSDVVFNLFLFLTIPLTLGVSPLTKKYSEHETILSNAVLLLLQIQVALIYLVSGVDKVYSHAWRSGDAMYSILKLDFFALPSLHEVSLGSTSLTLLAWTVILFELGFPLLIWFKKIRPYLLATGVLFHLFIVIFLTLPDFGLIMIIGYIPFLKGTLFNL